MMTSLRITSFLFAAVVVAFLVAFFAGRLPYTPNPDGMSAVEAGAQPVLREQNSNPELIVPASTLVDKPQGSPHNRVENPVAYILTRGYGYTDWRSPHNGAENPVAYRLTRDYGYTDWRSPDNRAENPVAYRLTRDYGYTDWRSPDNSGENPVAYFPEAASKLKIEAPVQ